MRRRFWIIAVSLFPLAFGAPASARTLDLLGLAAPQLDHRADRLELPHASPALKDGGLEDFRRAMRAFLTNDFQTAERLSRGLTQTAAEAPEGWYLLGMSLANLDRREDAIHALDQAAERYAENAAPLVVKGDLLLSLGRRDDAGAAWQEAIRVDPGNWRAQERMAAFLESRGDRTGAIRHYEQAVADASAGHVYPRLQAARLHLLTGNPARTEELLEDMARLDDAPSLALDYLARAKVGLDKGEEGKALFDRLIARSESVRPVLARARLAVADQDLAEAQAILAKGRTRFPGNPALLLEHGRLLGASGDYDQALSAFDEGLAAAPRDPGLLRAASLAAARLGQDDKAIGYARELADLPAATPDDLVRLAALVEKTGEGSEAAALYRKVLASDPDNWVALNNLAHLLTETAPDEAVSLAERAVALAPDVPTLRDTLGLAQQKAGDLDLAARTFEAMRTEQPTAALSAYRLGVVRLEEGRLEEGRSLLQEALSLDPDFAYAPQARQYLQ